MITQPMDSTFQCGMKRNLEEETMLKRSIVLASVILIGGSGCARRVPEPAVKVPGEPHVSWIIMFGDRDNADREFVCQSEPRTDCVMPASRVGEQVFSDIHFYYHGAKAATNYVGTNQIGFFQGTAPHTVKPDVTVKGNEEIINQSVNGIVTSKAGTYTMSIAVMATSGTIKRQIQDEVKVVVK